MKKNFKRTLTLLLAMLMLASMLASCSGGDDTAAEDTTASDTTASDIESTVEENPEPDVDGLNYDGADFTYLIRGIATNSYYEEHVYQEELNGEVINDAVVNRNGMIEDKLGIKIRVIEANEQDNDITLAQQYVLANDSTIDVFDIRKNQTGTLAMSGYLVDFNDLDYVNLTADYWDANAVTELAIADRLYMMPCDISMANLSASRFIFFNKKLIEDYSLEEPYQLVYDDKWTLDKFFEMSGKISEDLNGDGAFDHNDRYGMLTEEKENNGTVIHMLAASNLQMTGRDDEGMPTVNVMNEKVQSLIEKVYKNIENVNTAISYDKLQKTADIGTHPHIYTYARKVLFTNDQFLFVQNGLNVIKAFADMESDFGIVPNPKYDEDQEKYGHLIDKYALIFSIPVTCSNLERAAAVLEYSAWLSHTTLLPAYYDTTILSKRIRDERDVDMLDLVKASCFYDIAQIYGIGIDLAVWNAYTQGGNLASAYASAESVIQTKLDNLIEQFMK